MAHDNAYQIPGGDGEVRGVPPAAELPALARANTARLAGLSFRILDVPAAELARQVRRDLLRLAGEYTGLDAPDADLIVATGHQPVLCHPGVWFKNHLAARVAAELRSGSLGAASVNFIVDNDTVELDRIKAPASDGDGVGVHDIPFIACPRGVAAEEIAVPESAVDALREAARLARPALGDTLLDDYVAAVEPARSLVEFVSIPRRKLERTFGVRNLELPVSRLCSTDGFRLFFAHVARHADAFVRVYNAALDAHRAAHAITNPVEPSPNLAHEDGRLELPFWTWGAGEVRRPVFISVDAVRRVIHSGRAAAAELPDASAPETLDALRRIERSGLKIRPRALAMTMFFRLFCSDLFIHGISGARYERVNDRILAGFFGVEDPPPCAAASATLFLKPAGPIPSAGDMAELEQTVRRMKQTPERFVDEYLPDDAEARSLGRRRIELLDMAGLTKRERRKAYAEAQELAGRLQERMKPHILAAEKKARRLETARALAGDRTYPFFFHPRARLEKLYAKRPNRRRARP